MPENGNPLIVALRAVFGPLVKQSSKWPPVLAYGLPGIVAVLLITLLRPVLPNGVLWLVAAVILLPLVGYIITVYFARHHPLPPTGQQIPIATIGQPKENDTVKKTIECSGFAVGVQNNMHLWLAIETETDETETRIWRIWPKGEVLVDNTSGRWSAIIYEDGATKTFSISLYIANPVGHKIIQDWLEKGKLTGKYPHMTGIAGSDRLHRVDGLTKA